MINLNKNQRFLAFGCIFAGILLIWIALFKIKAKAPIIEKEAPTIVVVPSASPSATPTPTKPKPMTFEEMNKLYGPCTNLPVLMYHHVEQADNAKLYKRTGLNVPPETFRKQMEYLNSKGYVSITPGDLANFFDNGVKLPGRPILITFDDGYVDNGDLAFPIMRELGIKGTIYIPTGLMENFNYLTWAKIDEMKSSGFITFGNHTWSHKNVGMSHEVVTKEITTADTQLSDHGINGSKTFAYPYGLDTNYAEKLLTDMGYKLAFTTVPGRIMCKKQRLSLPRIRVGNSALSVFGI